ncbi:restriction endonuclease [Halomonas sp. M4R5S39]|uniref:restriction endonuclease n=1 Tax=Halomonas kalidii TaxID=3043293 RepID=UPI0024A89F54|nr:restriction endonuclease [Halomonas kalidii]MDI5983827.1 restriction endonuclease [Halomonas kalidii]
MSREFPQWEKYERLVAQLVTHQISTEYCVTPNASIKGKISSRKRQVDVLIDYRHDTDNRNRIVIDAKVKERRIDVNDVEAFLGLMEDVGATHGYLVCPNGYTASAERRAQEAVSLRLLPLDRLEDFDPSTWPSCSSTSRCKGKVFWNGYPSVDMLLVPLEAGSHSTKMTSYVHYVGICDRCRNFHIKCITCGSILTPSYDDEEDIGAQCQCKMPWFWLASVESDDHGDQSAELHLIEGVKQSIRTVSRRTL